jgi:predicted signal transduction protein with EAL and GGDEF domain
MTATARTFSVKSETADGSLNLIPCFEPRQVFENLEDQRKVGREARVEDAGEKVLDEMTQRWRRRQPVVGARLGIAIDGFGTGYSFLECLLTFRVGRIKIAQQFANGLPDDHGSSAIVRATIGLAREFDVEIIAEGVDTNAQLEFLMRAGCSCIQGFCFSRPVPAGQATQLLRQGVVAPAPQRQLTARRPATAQPEGITA